MKSKIYIFCSATRNPSGGVKQLFKMADHLNDIGYEAFLIRKSKFKSIKWFKFETRIIYFPYLYFLLKHLVIKQRDRSDWKFKILNFLFFNKRLPEKDSIIIYPEIYGPNISNLLPENKFIIFNQNAYLTYNLFDYNKHVQNEPYLCQRMLGAITVSENSTRYLNFVYPQLAIYRLYLGISTIFKPAKNKKKQIAFMPRKLQEDSNQVLNILKRRNKLFEWEIVTIDNVSEEQVAKILSEASIFLCFNHQEGLGLPPLEAMASGCFVIGYCGQAGKEYMKPQFSTPIPEGDIISYVDAVEMAIETFDSNPELILEKGLIASSHVQGIFTIPNERDSIKKAFEALLNNIA